MNLARYHAANLPELIEKINRNSIGMDDYLNRFWDGVDTTSNYPPYNIVTIEHYNNLYSLCFYEKLRWSRRSNINRFFLTFCHFKNTIVYIIKEGSTFVNPSYVGY